MHLAEELRRAGNRGIDAPVHVANDADAIAAGLPPTRGQSTSSPPGLDAWQRNRLRALAVCGRRLGGGHVTVTLDPKEKFCGCGGGGPP